MKLTWNVESLGSNITRWATMHDGMSISMLEGIPANKITWYVDEISTEGIVKTALLGQHAAVKAIKEYRESELETLLILDDSITVEAIQEGETDLEDTVESICILGTKDSLPETAVISIGDEGSFFKGSLSEFTQNFGISDVDMVNTEIVEAVATAINEPYSIELPEDS